MRNFFDLKKLKKLASETSKNCSEGDVITLSGPLGVGKTTFTKFFIRSLMKEDIDVTSPTYTIIQTYQPHKGPEIWHMDFYRLNNSVDINDLDLDEAFSKAISIIEWPEKLDNIIPKIRTSIRFDFIDKIPSKREIQVKSNSCNIL